MNYVRNYYKNLCEKYEYQIHNLQNKVLNFKLLFEMEGGQFGCPDGNCEPIKVGDSGPILAQKQFQTPGGGQESGNYINSQNYQQLIQYLMTLMNNPPSWWNLSYWPSYGGQQFSNPLMSWNNFIANIVAGVQLAALNRPDQYLRIQSLFYSNVHHAGDNNMGSHFWPLKNSNGQNWNARYSPIPNSKFQVHTLQGFGTLQSGSNMDGGEWDMGTGTSWVNAQ